jgi:hypothetical protein
LVLGVLHFGEEEPAAVLTLLQQQLHYVMGLVVEEDVKIRR